MFKITPLITKALRIAYNQHQGQSDRGGVPYIFHPYNVASQCHRFYVLNPGAVSKELDYETLIITALLHDVLEDTDYGLEDVEREFPGNEDLLLSLAIISKLPDSDRDDYISHIATAGEIYPIIVKIMDLQENMRPDRVCGDVAKQEARNRIYAKELAFLKQKLHDCIPYVYI